MQSDFYLCYDIPAVLVDSLAPDPAVYPEV